MAVNEISNEYIRTYEANVIHLVQQKFSKLRRTVTEKSPGATNQHRFQIISPRGAMTAKTSGTNAAKRPNTPYADTTHNNRVVTTQAYGTADSFEWDDVVRMIADPQSILTTAMAMQIGRRYDDTIITAALAAALDEAGNSNSHPAANQLGGAATAPSFTLVQSAREAILEKDIDPDEECYLVVSPNFVMKLLEDAKATSGDYVNGRSLMSGGIVQGWMGFTWICSNRLTKAVVGPPAQIYGLAYTKDSIGLSVIKDAFTKIGEDPGQSFSTTVYMGVDIGAVRIQDDKVFRIHYLETN